MSARTEGDTDYLVLSGELDFINRGELEDALISRAHHRVVVVDVSGLTFIDSQGVAAFLHAHKEFEGQGNRLDVLGARGAVRRVFEIMGLKLLSD